MLTTNYEESFLDYNLTNILSDLYFINNRITLIEEAKKTRERRKKDPDKKKMQNKKWYDKFGKEYYQNHIKPKNKNGRRDKHTLSSDIQTL